MDPKARIAKRALAEVPDEGAILIDAGTITSLLADLLPDRELTVVTNSPEIAARLSLSTRLTVMVVGGRLHRDSRSTVDEWSLRLVENIFVDVAFIDASCLSVANGPSAANDDSAAVKRAMIGCARRAIVLADHTAIESGQPAVFAPLADIDTVITDSDIDPVVAKEIAEAGPTVVTA